VKSLMRAALALAVLVASAAGLARAMSLASSDIRDGAPMPRAQIYSACGGQNVSPALAWSGAPAATGSFALTMIDHDVKPADWSHWIIVDIPPGVRQVARGAGGLAAPARGLRSNMDSDRYAGPCPPPGSGVHHYEITIWALPTPAATPPAPGSATELRAALAKASIAHASIVATAGH